MAAQVDSHNDMAQARRTDGLSVIFDQNSPDSSRCRSRSRSSSSASTSCSTSSNDRGRRSSRGRCGSSSSSSSSSSSGSSSSSRSRSRSYPRCHRQSSRCRCDDHGKHSRYDRRSPPRRYRARSRSYSHSPSWDRYYRHRRYYRSPSRSRSPRRWYRYRRPVSQLRCTFSRSPSRTYRGRSRSRSPIKSLSLSLHDKKKLLEVAKTNAMQMFGVASLDLPESVKPILSEDPESKRSSPEPMTRLRQDSPKTEDSEPEPDESSPKMSPRMKIAFSDNNSVAKPTVAVPSSAKVTPRVDSVESRKPYGHWVPIGSGKNSSLRKRT
ncbi:arginine/serine-rich protein 1 [Nematolebias whitei]|uniref:arginine/serine-rich protein 1 n=1 Tax=Nematolebias whitei TaxID=451745 RepID=UPI00189C1950|nr:arginine/serine-rich protein 1 [Nematolebias whitei]